MTTITTKLYETSIDIELSTRRKVIDLLNNTLAATLDLWTQAKQAHWNVKGTDFYQLHLLFDELAGEVYNYIDLVAERITTLAGTALGTCRMSAKTSFLPEYPIELASGIDHVKALAERYASYAKHVRQQIDATANLGDATTADLYTEISRGIDQRLWFLEAHIQKSSS